MAAMGLARSLLVGLGILVAFIPLVEGLTQQRALDTLDTLSSERVHKPAGWFGDFDQMESTFNEDGVGGDRGNPEQRFVNGKLVGHWSPYVKHDLVNYEAFDESPSNGDYDAWQTHYPAVDGSMAANHVRNGKWRYTPEGWIQDYNPSTFTHVHDTRKTAGWFDSSVLNFDGFGRPALPIASSGRRLYPEYQEKSVNTSLKCDKPGCTVAVSLQAFDATKQEGRHCVLSTFAHPTDFDDDWSEEYISWKVNNAVVLAKCDFVARGCNKTAERPLHSCVRGFPVDSLIDSAGTLKVEGKISEWVDECAMADGSLLSAVGMVTCLVRDIPTKATVVPSSATTAAEMMPTIPALPTDWTKTVLLQCTGRGCNASTRFNFDPTLIVAGGKCLLSVNITQTDYDDDMGLPENIEYLALDGKNLTADVKPGKNPCNLAYQGEPLSDAELIYELIKDKDVTSELLNATGGVGVVHLTAKNSPHVDECAHNGWLLDGVARLHCTPGAGNVSGAKILLQTGAAQLEETIATPREGTSFCDTGNGWVHEWGDEFDGDQLDTANWDVVGNRDRDAVTSPVGALSTTACRSADCRDENVRVSGGMLHLLSDRDPGNTTRYYTGAVTTRGKRSWADEPAYRVCISAKLPGGSNGQGVWPAHWMLPDNGYSDKCLDEGEMDIMEMVNGDGGLYNTFHWMSSWPKLKCADFDTYHKSSHRRTSLLDKGSSTFHEFAIERSGDHMAFALDGRVVHTVLAADTGAALSHTPYFLILNTAIGGAWPGEPTSSTAMPTEHVIDYVRAARRSTDAVGNIHHASSTGHGSRISMLQIHEESVPPPPLSF